jgi:hypothetical protein
MPPCETTGLVNLCEPATLITAGSWFTMQVPNLVWFLSLAVLVVGGLFVPFPTREIPAAVLEREGRP